MLSLLAQINPTSKQAANLATSPEPGVVGFSSDNKIPQRVENSDPFDAAPPATPVIPRTPIKLSPPVTAAGAPLYDPSLRSKLLQGTEAQMRHAEHLVSPQIGTVAAGKPVQSSLTYGVPGAADNFQRATPEPSTQHPLNAPFFPAHASDWFAVHEKSPEFTRALMGVAREKLLPQKEGAPEYEPEAMRTTLTNWHRANPSATSFDGPSPFAAPSPTYVDAVMRQQQAEELQRVREPGITARTVPTPEETKHLYAGPYPKDRTGRNINDTDINQTIRRDTEAAYKSLGLPQKYAPYAREFVDGSWRSALQAADQANLQSFVNKLLRHEPEAERAKIWQELMGDPEQLGTTFFNRHNTPDLNRAATKRPDPLPMWRASQWYPKHLRPVKQAANLATLDRAAEKLQEVVEADQIEKAPTTARPEDKRHRDALIAEARLRHFQDQPFGTAAMVGGATGVGLPLLLAAIANPSMYTRSPGKLLQMSAAGGVVGTGAGLGVETIGRLLTRNFGPKFRTNQWHRDQDPNRWNTALRATPLAVAALAGRTLPTMYDAIKGAGTMANVQDGPKPPGTGFDLDTPDGQAAVLGTAAAAKATTSAAAAPPTLAGPAAKAAPVAAKGLFGKGVSLLGKGLGKAMLPWTASNAMADANLHGGLDYEAQQGAVDQMRNDWNTSGWKGKALTALGVLDAPATGARAAGILPGVQPQQPSNVPPAHFGPPPTGGPTTDVPPIKPAPQSHGWGGKFRTPIKQARNDLDLRKRIAAACKQVTLPDLKEIEHGQYQKGHFSWKGLRITLESAPGAVRRGVDKDGTKWQVKLKNAYGYIKGTTSAEVGDQMDVFVGPHPESEIVFVVDQNKQKSKVFDEHKCVIGCRTTQEAKELYLDNYSESWTGFRAVTALTLDQFKSWLKRGDMTSPLAGQQFKEFHKQAGLLDELRAKTQSAGKAVTAPLRRYLSNLPDLYTYGPQHITKFFQHLPKAYEMGIEDKRISTPGYVNPTTDGIRHELFRRGLDVHKPSPQDYLKPVGDVVQVADRLAPNDKLDPNAASSLIGHLVEAGLLNPQPIYQAAQLARRAGTGGADPAVVNVRTASPALSNYTLTYKGNGIFNVRDKWDVGLNPGESVWDGRKVAPALGRVALDKLMKPAVFDQDFQQLRDGSVVRLPIKKSSTRDILEEVRRQLPGFHKWEAGAGALAGAGLGYGYHKLRGWSGQKYRNKDQSKLTLLKRVLTGALAGGAGANVLSDRLRRYVSNIPNPVGYDAPAQIKDLNKAGWRGFVEGFVKDRPIYMTAEKGLDHSIVRHLRRETMRRGFNVHTENPKTDFLKVLGSAEDGAPVLGLADRFFDKTHKLLDTDEAKALWAQVRPHQLDVAMGADAGKYTPATSPYFGNFSTRRLGDGTLQFYDRWDFDLHPEEREKLKSYLNSWWEHVKKDPNPGHWSPQFILGKDKTEQAITMAARHVVDKTIASKMPFFFQSFAIPPAPEANLDLDDYSAGAVAAAPPLPSRVPLFGEKS